VTSMRVIGEGMWHVYPLYGRPEGKEAIEEMSAFIRTRLGLDAQQSLEQITAPANNGSNGFEL